MNKIFMLIAVWTARATRPDSILSSGVVQTANLPANVKLNGTINHASDCRLTTYWNKIKRNRLTQKTDIVDYLDDDRIKRLEVYPTLFHKLCSRMGLRTQSFILHLTFFHMFIITKHQHYYLFHPV